MTHPIHEQPSPPSIFLAVRLLALIRFDDCFGNAILLHMTLLRNLNSVAKLGYIYIE